MVRAAAALAAPAPLPLGAPLRSPLARFAGAAPFSLLLSLLAFSLYSII